MITLMEWYRSRLDRYPWRGVRDPYLVLVSEVMLQQTQASRVVPAYRSFVERFPSVRALAAAARADVLRAWGSLGYPRRAVGLHRAAGMVMSNHGGRIPSDVEALRRLPGIGPYTAAAVASLGFGAPVPALDVNVRRVVARAAIGDDAAAPAAVRDAAEGWLDPSDPGAWNQALMDVGREHCRPKPRCDGCPLSSTCAFRRRGASPVPPRRRQGRYEGSMRQLRGAILRKLREEDHATVAALARASGRSLDDVRAALRSLMREGMVSATPAALGGSRRGRISLAR